MPVRFSWSTWFRYSMRSWTRVKRGWTTLMRTATKTRVRGSRASITEASLKLVANIMLTLPMNIRGAMVNILRPMLTTIWTWFMSLVSRVRSCPVVKSSRLPKLYVCTFLNIASLRSASKPLEALTAKMVLPTTSAALRMLTPIIRRLVLRMRGMFPTATPSSMMT